ncbi:hypothetical protein [Streptomyces sp. NPDC057686]|uniref:hypothetical protein n=1 Tax=Streptomyces sp. NPDC057686 TaxID=3346212 RepID=UPI00367CC6E7
MDEPTAALREEPWRAAAWHQKLHGEPSIALTVLAEATGRDALGTSVRDQPISFAPSHRRYALRSIVSTTVDVPNPHHRPDRPPAPALRRALPVPRHTPEALLVPIPPQFSLDGR